jgi:hypothetical protein
VVHVRRRLVTRVRFQVPSLDYEVIHRDNLASVVRRRDAPSTGRADTLVCRDQRGGGRTDVGVLALQDETHRRGASSEARPRQTVYLDE